MSKFNCFIRSPLTNFQKALCLTSGFVIIPTTLATAYIHRDRIDSLADGVLDCFIDSLENINQKNKDRLPYASSVFKTASYFCYGLSGLFTYSLGRQLYNVIRNESGTCCVFMRNGMAKSFFLVYPLGLAFVGYFSFKESKELKEKEEYNKKYRNDDYEIMDKED